MTDSGKRPASPLAIATFRAIWIAATISFIGSFVQDVAERWVILDLTGSPLPSALLGTAFVTASLLGMLPAGVLADRRDRRTLVIASQALQGAAAGAVAVLSLTGHLSPGVLLCGAAAVGLGMSLGAPAFSAMISDLVPRELVAEAISLNAVAFNIARAVGPAIGGLVLSTFGPTTSFALNAVSFIGVGLAVLAHPIPRTRHEGAHEPVLRAFAEPLRLPVRDAGIRAVLVAMMLFTFGASMVYGLAPAYGKEALRASPAQYGVMFGAMGVGAVLVTRVLRPLRPRVTPRALVAFTAALYAACALALSGVSSIAAATLLFLPAGAGWTGTFASLTTLVQLWTPARLLARAIALYTVVHFATWAVGSSVGGVLAAGWSIRAAMLVGGALCGVAAIVMTRLPLPATFMGPPGSIPPRALGEMSASAR